MKMRCWGIGENGNLGDVNWRLVSSPDNWYGVYEALLASQPVEPAMPRVAGKTIVQVALGGGLPYPHVCCWYDMAEMFTCALNTAGEVSFIEPTSFFIYLFAGALL